MDINLATGNLWQKFDDNFVKTFPLIKKLNIQGIEITTAFSDLAAVKFSKDDLKWLKSLKRVSVHAPFGYEHIKNDKKLVSKKVLQTNDLYNKVNAETLVVHANEQSFIREITKKTDMHISIEHMEPHKSVNLTKFASLLRKYPQAGVCMDVSHNYSWGIDETAKMINKFKDRISEVHFSGTRNKVTHRAVSLAPKNFFKSIKPLKDLDTPIVIEEDMGLNNLTWIRKEIKFIKDTLNFL